jgi:two-component system chemotaxis sensor kinase CheA
MDFLEEEYKEIIDIFKSETEEHLDKINQSLVNLEKNPADNFLIDNIFREAHSLKGSARMLGFNDIQSLAHQLESVISQVKNKILRINPQIIDLLYENTDCIRLIVDKSIQTKGEYSNPAIQVILKNLTSF